jgi:hypothetical protein
MFFNNELSPEDQLDINLMIESYKKEQSEKSNKKKQTQEEYLRESYTKLMKVQYNPFDSLIFENKMNTDLYFYDVILKDKLDEVHLDEVSNSLRELYELVHDIYYHINIEPEFYKNLDENFLLESIEDKNLIVKDLFSNYIKKNYFDMSLSERAEKYQSLCENNIAEFMKVKVPSEKAIEFGFKTYLLENFLTEVAFPKFVWKRVLALQEDENYKAIFDYERLNVLVEMFKNKIHEISQVASLCI